MYMKYVRTVPKYAYISLLLLCITTHNTPLYSEAVDEKSVKKAEKEVVIIDAIIATVFTTNGSRIICTSDMRPTLDGAKRTFDDVVLDKLIELDAETINIIISDDEIDRFLETVQKDAGLDREHLSDLFSQLGYSYEEGRAQVRLKQLIDRVIEYRVRNHGSMIIEKKDVVAFYDAHPEYNEEEYVLRQAVVLKKDWENESIIWKAAKENKLYDTVNWEEPFTIKASEVAIDKSSMLNKAAKNVVSVEATEEGYEITYLEEKHEKHLKTLDERYDQISYELQKNCFDKNLKEYQEKVRAAAKVERYE